MPVQLCTLAPADLEQRYRASGTLVAVQFAELRPLQVGIVTAIEVDEGDVVEEGDTLAKLDSRELSLMASRDRITADNAKKELARLEALQNLDAFAQQEIDDLRFQLKSAKAAARLSRHQAAQSVVRAPFDGTITARHVDPGNLATSATTMFEIADLRTLELELHLPEREALKVVGEAEVRLELLDGTTFDAKVYRRAPVVDPLTGTVKLTVRTSEFPANAVPGAFVRAKILLESRSQAPSLPKSAVFDVDGAPHVYVIEEGKARRIPIETGLEGEEQVEVVSGLESDRKVVTDTRGITDGMALKSVSQADDEADAAIEASPSDDSKGHGKSGRRRKKGR